MHNCIDLKRRTKATYDTTINEQGTVQDYLHELTTCRLAAILQNFEFSPSKTTSDYAWQLRQANPTTIERFHFQRVLFSVK